MREIYLRVITGDHVCLIGSWKPTDNDRNDNFEAHKDLGWHVFWCLYRGADKVEIVIGDMTKDSNSGENKAEQIVIDMEGV